DQGASSHHPTRESTASSRKHRAMAAVHHCRRCYRPPPHRSPAISSVVAIDHVSCRRTLLTQTGDRRLHPRDHTAFIVDQIVIEVTQFGSAISLGQVRRIRVGGRHLVLLVDGLAIAVLLL